MKLKTKLTAAALTLAIAGGVGVTAVHANTQANTQERNHQVRQHFHHVDGSEFDLEHFSLDNFSIEDVDFGAIRDRLVQSKEHLLAMTEDEMQEMAMTHFHNLQERMGSRENMMGMSREMLAGLDLDFSQFNREDFSPEEAKNMLLELLPEGFEGFDRLERGAGNGRFHGFHRN